MEIRQFLIIFSDFTHFIDNKVLTTAERQLAKDGKVHGNIDPRERQEDTVRNHPELSNTI